jgi:hypothetical protein
MKLTNTVLNEYLAIAKADKEKPVSSPGYDENVLKDIELCIALYENELKKCEPCRLVGKRCFC